MNRKVYNVIDFILTSLYCYLTIIIEVYNVIFGGDIMDVVARIKELMKVKGWNTYTLAMEAGLTTSTLYGVMNGRTQPTIVTIESLCIALNISLSDFFDVEIKTPSELETINNDYAKLSDKDKKLVDYLIEYLARMT